MHFSVILISLDTFGLQMVYVYNKPIAPAVYKRGSIQRGRNTHDALTELHELCDVIRDAFVRPGCEVKMLNIPGRGALKRQISFTMVEKYVM